MATCNSFPIQLIPAPIGCTKIFIVWMDLNYLPFPPNSSYSFGGGVPSIQYGNLTMGEDQTALSIPPVLAFYESTTQRYAGSAGSPGGTGFTVQDDILDEGVYFACPGSDPTPVGGAVGTLEYQIRYTIDSRGVSTCV
jgi:hypothetical protein